MRFEVSFASLLHRMTVETEPEPDICRPFICNERSFLSVIQGKTKVRLIQKSGTPKIIGCIELFFQLISGSDSN